MRAIAVKEFRERDRADAAPARPAHAAGRDLCIPGGDLAAVRAALDVAGVPARLAVVPVIFEETFVRLVLARQDPVPSAPERTSQ